MTHQRRLCIFPIIGFFLLASCITTQGLYIPIVFYNDWYDPPDDIHEFTPFQAEIFQVKEDRRMLAIDMLASSSYIVLSKDELTQLTGRELQGTFILIRAICFSFSIDGFDIYANGKNLLIEHHTMGIYYFMKKCPIVIEVEEAPENVFTACHSAI